MDLLNTEEALRKYVDLVIASAKQNLATGGKYGSHNASGSLSESIVAKPIEFTDKGIEAGISMNSYGEFVDKGVNGRKSAYTTPYSYKDKMPPTSKLDKWVVRRKIAPRDAKGKFLPRKSVLFAIAMGIYQNGMKPTLFMTKPFDEMRKNLPIKLITAFREDAKVELKTVFDQ